MPSKAAKKAPSTSSSPWADQPPDAMSLHSQAGAGSSTSGGGATPYRDDADDGYSDAAPRRRSVVYSNGAIVDDYDSDDSDSSLSYVAAPEDPPPLYSDDPAANDASLALASATNPLLPPSAHVPLPGGMHPPVPTRIDAEGNETFVDKRLDSDPVYLEHTLAHLALFPPRPYARVVGTHTETTTTTHSAGSSTHSSRHGHGHGHHHRTESRTSTQTITDFDVRVDLTPFLYRNINRHEAWRTVRPVGNFDKVRRGTVFATRAPGFGGSGAANDGGEDGTPSLREWCHRYCASPRRLRSFIVRRRVTGLDEDLLRSRLVALVRATQYRGHLDVSFPTLAERVHVRSDCWENRWRADRRVRWFFYLTFLWLLSWPYLLLRTIYFETVTVDWAFSRPRDPAARARDDPSRPPRPAAEREFVTLSEDAWYKMWARAVQAAVLERRQCMLDQGDLRRAAAEVAEEPSSFADTLASGGGGAAGGFMRAGLNAMNIVDRQFGWGHNR
jgi:hypothetical protein